MAYTTPKTWATDEVLTSGDLNTHLRDNVSFLANVPACRINKTTTQSIANATETSITFDAERFDTDNMHSLVTNTERITFNTAGVYVVTFNCEWVDTASAGIRALHIRKNGTTIIASDQESSIEGADATQASATMMTISTIYKFNAADYIEARVFQNAGGAISIGAASSERGLEFAAAWLGLG